LLMYARGQFWHYAAISFVYGLVGYHVAQNGAIGTN